MNIHEEVRNKIRLEKNRLYQISNEDGIDNTRNYCCSAAFSNGAEFALVLVDEEIERLTDIISQLYSDGMMHEKYKCSKKDFFTNHRLINPNSKNRV